MAANTSQAWWHKKRYRWALIGSALSILGPIGEWLFLSLFQKADIPSIWLTYIYTEILVLICFTSFGYILGKKTEKIEYIAFHDSLTDTYNRGYLMRQFEELLRLQQRYEQPFSVLMLDLDYFKQVNDQYGHLVGDKTLRSISVFIKQSARISDIVGRYGGEEFIVLCPNTTRDDIINLAERIRENISQLSEEQLGHPGTQTVSIGVLTLASQSRHSLKYVIQMLDNALYQAKNDGRNRFHVAQLNLT